MLNGTTQQANAMKIPRQYFGMTAVLKDVSIVVCGGFIEIDVICTNKCEKYTNGKWTFMPSLPISMFSFTMTTLNGTPYTFGGYDGTNLLNNVYMFDFGVNRWINRSSVPANIDGCAIVPAKNNSAILQGCFIN
jgi:hypothetical protein